MRSPHIAAALVMALVAGLGCSVAFVDKPPVNHASLRYFDCTSSRMAPITDTALAGLLGLAALGSQSDSSHDSTATVEVTVLTAAALASAIYGYSNVGHCRDAKEALGQRLAMEPLLPRAPFAAAVPAPLGGPAVDPWLAAGPPPSLGAPPPAPPAPDGGATEGGAP